MNAIQSRQIHIDGVVQGVGFRPFVYSLAQRYALCGWVRNTSAGVDIVVEGPNAALDAFVAALSAEAPPLAKIDAVQVNDMPANGYTDFEIVHSADSPDAFMPISADVSLCDDCLRELRDPSDRRYRYPFINCTNCGPRFTIIKAIPYDRPLTTMADFPMCEDCAREYHDPLDRRFHAQPVACPSCGPQVWLVEGDQAAPLQADQAVRRTVDLLKAGQVVAIKGLGGFHLACDARATEAVRRLRQRKRRFDKPLALMLRDVDAARKLVLINDDEEALLTSRQRPIVLLNTRPEADIAPEVAPGQTTLGIMLPYTPLHVLLFEDQGEDEPLILVMTSGNRSEEPIVTTNEDALSQLGDIADAFLLHDRDIHVRCDDAVVRWAIDAELPIRRSRGYAPYPVQLPLDQPPTLAVGAELKNTFCVTRDRYAFLSHHIGDMENLETLQSFRDGIAHFESLFRIKPRLIAADLHPDYAATRYAIERAQQEGIALRQIQHHHAHIAACLAEHGHPGDRPVIGVAWDGTGYGKDGSMWGGEFMLVDYQSFTRKAHIKSLPLPGGDAAVRRPARAAFAWLLASEIDIPERLSLLKILSEEEQRIIRQQVQIGLNSPLTSSIGRLFDVIAALVGLRHEITYEGQAAIELEGIAWAGDHGAYPLRSAAQIDVRPLLQWVLQDSLDGVPAGLISARFHRGLALLIRDSCLALRLSYGLDEVALSGGVFQNVTLLRQAVSLLREAGFTVYTHRLVPPNDGGLALGQAVIAAAQERADA
ncbi:MAG: carbamoyltransferase HypF [Chloroflexi bacterium]|nr:carbamoyltransferase HypF [Chloroflexota bacterium]